MLNKNILDVKKVRDQLEAALFDQNFKLLNQKYF